ncbi:protein FAM162A-like isoform X1 [Rhinatrema bivittatum]|uniref:protein FAM162A-like isoform X1 n=1 Tax=Rhinatrema bivittatum TaxID=194408 RepID=UPI0011265E58|nr:protein FAM162A-like isoform X1 [Rhinatrema bivittatum]
MHFSKHSFRCANEKGIINRGKGRRGGRARDRERESRNFSCPPNNPFGAAGIDTTDPEPRCLILVTDLEANSGAAPTPGYKPFRNERRPTPLDKKILLWAGRFRKEEDIPAFVSLEVINAATNKVRIKICYVMIAITLLGCVAMVIAGKNAARRDDNLLKMNMEKKAKWKTEAGKEDDSVALKQQ